MESTITNAPEKGDKQPMEALKKFADVIYLEAKDKKPKAPAFPDGIVEGIEGVVGFEIGSDQSKTTLGYIMECARKVGMTLPEKFHFGIGQVFFDGANIDEVRLDGIALNPDDERPTRYKTELMPSIQFFYDSIWQRQDETRAFICAIVEAAKEEYSPKVSKGATIRVSFDFSTIEDVLDKWKTPTTSSDHFPIYTSQEMDILMLSASDGIRQSNWRNEQQRGRRLWESRGASHRVELATEREERSIWDFAVLEKLTGAQNSDFALAMLYVVGILAPPSNLPPNRLAVDWIDLNDVMQKIGWFNEKPNAQKKEVLRHQLWRFLVYGEEAIVTGQRSIKYVDKDTKEEIPTRIESPIWRVMARQMPDQDSLFSEERPAPLRAQIAISKQWEPLLSAPQLAQYFPLGELLGAIPPNKVSGDWARSIGLILARLWRCDPRETLAGKINPTRRELLTHYAPKTKSVEEILDSDNPKRALEYYRDALNILLEAGLIAPKGDAGRDVTPGKMLESFGRKGWGGAWLGGTSGLCPGAKWIPTVEDRANALPPLRPKDLKAKPKRPRKTLKVA